MDVSSAVTLRNGVEMPRLGLGVRRATSGRDVQDALRWAFEAGYRHVDTARLYGNERDVGKALRESGRPREQVFITTELKNRDHGYERAARAQRLTAPAATLRPCCRAARAGRPWDPR
jgi:diketogulonate reductase-like aldo/keto reductase